MLFRVVLLIVACFQPWNEVAANLTKGVCDLPSKQCLLFLPDELAKAEPYSRQWYSLKLLQLDSMMTSKEFKLLKQELKVLDNNQDHPPIFSTHLNIYRAKLLLIEGDIQPATELLNQSVEELQQFNQSFYSPMRMISIANLLHVTLQFSESLVLLEQIEEDYKHSRDLHLKLELNGNLGHVHKFLGNQQQALDYYKLSLQAAIELGVEQQIAVLHEHVGNMYAKTQQFELAELSYLEALSYANKDGRDVSINHAKIILADFYLQQDRLQKAKALVSDLEGADIQPHQQKFWRKLSQLLD